MSEKHSIDKDFLDKISGIIEKNLSNEQFGVSELAHEAGMSRSNLLRRIKKSTDLSASIFIRQVRLKNAMEMLRNSPQNVSEVAYEVGFSSTSYFIKCFREEYGYPPGEVSKRDIIEDDDVQKSTPKKKKVVGTVSLFFLLIIIIVSLFIFLKPFSQKKTELEKSIAVLPFKNDSNDSTNVYIINGLMEAILNNLQKIEDLRVTSRTSVEKYRDTPKLIHEISDELNVSYIVEGSGQKIGERILLNVQLIEATTDNHLWAGQFEREVKDIFSLQQDVAKSIAEQVEVIITPEETERIDKIPTDDLVAYDYFLKGLDLLFKEDEESLRTAISWFEKAIEKDNEFANAYADLAIAYYFLDANQAEKKYAEQINTNADNALLFDPKLPQSLIAKALFYYYNDEYELAVPYLEKALEYNPNSALVINILSDLYARYLPDTKRYLEYALKGIQLDIASNDSTTTSFIYLHVSNAFIQSGFVDEAEYYINNSIAFNPANLYSEYVKAYILFAKNKDLKQLNNLLLQTFQKDTSRLDVLQEVAKSYYFLRDFKSAYLYYKPFTDIREAYSLDIFNSENAKIGVVFAENDELEKSEKYFNDFKVYAENDISVYKHLSLAAWYSWHNRTQEALEHFRLFSQQENYHYWIILFTEIDPLMDNIKDQPEFKKIMNEVKSRFREYQQQIKKSLEEKSLI
jgi:TolB-like protein/AraC-like DNA-binding protein/Tfp pilus assembly protein PilF